MASVWYLGGASKRIIKASDWGSKGITAPDNVWNSANGWSIPATSFTADQLQLLEMWGFRIDAPDGPREDIVPIPEENPLPQYLQESEILGSDGKLLGSRLPERLGESELLGTFVGQPSTAPTEGQVLVWDAALGEYKPSTISGTAPANVVTATVDGDNVTLYANGVEL